MTERFQPTHPGRWGLRPGQLAQLIGAPLAVWIALAGVIWVNRPPTSPQRVRSTSQQHAKRRCSLWDWKVPAGEGQLIPRWHVEAREALTAQRGEGELEEHLIEANCDLFDTLGSATLFQAFCPEALYSYTTRALTARAVTWRLWTSFDWRSAQERAAPTGHGTCAELHLKFTRPTPELEMRHWTAVWEPLPREAEP